MDNFRHARVFNDAAPQPSEAPLSAPTYVRLHPKHDVLVIGAPGLALATAVLASGASVITLIAYALPPDSDPDEEAVGMAHNMTVEGARSIALGLNELCDAAEAGAADLATAAINRARGR